MTTREYVADRIIQLCRERNMTFHALAMSAAVPPSTLRCILNGRSRNPGIVTIKMLCDAMDISLTEFFDTEGFRSQEQSIR